METRVRKNTVKLVCPSGSRIPSHLEVLKFTLNILKIRSESLHSVYKDENENRFYLKFMDETEFADFVKNLDDSYSFSYEDGSTVKVSLEMASRIFRYVRIFSLPPEIEDKEIAHVLGQFGTIRQYVRERFAAEHGVAIYTGVRGVHMEIAKEIPPHIYIGHFRARIYYDGLKNKCFLCKAEGHFKADCPKSIGGALGSSSSSYAAVTAQGRAAEYPVSLASSKTHGCVVEVSDPSPSTSKIESIPPSVVKQKLCAEQGNNEQSEQSNKELLVHPVETQGSAEETMETDEAKTTQKRAASSEEETGVEATDITPKNKRGAKKNKGEQILPSDIMENKARSRSRSTTK